MDDPIRIVEILVGQLVRSSGRRLRRRDLAKLVASIKALGLIEPIQVRRDGDNYRILDGHARYSALLELGVPLAPCIVVNGESQA